MTISMIALILLAIAFVGIFLWRKLGYWSPPSERQVREANAGDGGVLMYTSHDHDKHHPADGHGHSGDVGDSGSGDSGSAD